MGFVEFAKRHRRKLAITVGVGAAAYWAVTYVSQKLSDLQTKLLLDRAAQEDLARRFEQNQRDATFTTMALFPTASAQIMDEFDVENTRLALKNLRSESNAIATPSESASLPQTSEGSGDNAPSLTGSSFYAPRSKAELWNDLKISSITRAFVLIYTGAFLTLLTRIQLNILGRQAYADYVQKSYELGNVNLNAKEERDVLNRQYLTYSYYLLHMGWKVLADRIKPVVERVTSDLAATNRLDMAQMESILGQIHQQVTATENFGFVVLPPPEKESLVREKVGGFGSQIGDELQTLLSETMTVAESSSARDVLDEMVHNALSVLTSQLKPSFPVGGGVRLANALLVIAAQGQNMAAGSPVRNSYMEAMAAVPELDALSAAIYSNYAAK